MILLALLLQGGGIQPQNVTGVLPFDSGWVDASPVETSPLFEPTYTLLFPPLSTETTRVEFCLNGDGQATIGVTNDSDDPLWLEGSLSVHQPVGNGEISDGQGGTTILDRWCFFVSGNNFSVPASNPIPPHASRYIPISWMGETVCDDTWLIVSEWVNGVHDEFGCFVCYIPVVYQLRGETWDPQDYDGLAEAGVSVYVEPGAPGGHILPPSCRLHGKITGYRQ